jgi:hypothetical protein
MGDLKKMVMIPFQNPIEVMTLLIHKKQHSHVLSTHIATSPGPALYHRSSGPGGL